MSRLITAAAWGTAPLLPGAQLDSCTALPCLDTPAHPEPALPASPALLRTERCADHWEPSPCSCWQELGAPTWAEVLGHTILPENALFSKGSGQRDENTAVQTCSHGKQLCAALSWWADLLRNTYKGPSNLHAENFKECYCSIFHCKGHKIVGDTVGTQECLRHFQLTYPLWHPREKKNFVRCRIGRKLDTDLCAGGT